MAGPVDFATFLEYVKSWAHVDDAAAERATRATLQTLSEHLAAGDAQRLGKQLPAELLGWLHKVGPPEGFDSDEFMRRVAEREGVDAEVAYEHARAVLYALRRSLSNEELAKLAAALPEDVQALLVGIRIMPADEFFALVAERTGLDLDGAARATHAVLETVAERIAPGDVHDLVSRLPLRLHESLKRGQASADTSARRMSMEEFVRRVAAREDTNLDTAYAHARAVLATLRKAVSEEFFDLRVQLPPDYSPLLVRQ